MCKKIKKCKAQELQSPSRSHTVVLQGYLSHSLRSAPGVQCACAFHVEQVIVSSSRPSLTRSELLRAHALLVDFRRLLLLQIMPDGNANPGEPNDTRNNPVCDLATCCVIGKPQAQASLDEGKSQEDTAPPDV